MYFLSLDGGVTVKIGTTTNPRVRFNALAKKATAELQILAAFPGSYKEERAVHRKFRDLSTGIGEFFRLTPELRRYCKETCTKWPNWRKIIDSLNERNDLDSRRPGLRRRDVRPSGWYDGVERRFA